MTQIPTLVVAAATLLLAGCAASHAPLARVAPAAQEAVVVPSTPAAAAPMSTRTGANAAYVARVEQIARRRGIAVQWVHPPLTRVAVAD